MTKIKVDVAEYPRVYRPTGFWRVAFILSGTVFVGVSGTGLWFAANGTFASQGARILAESLWVLGLLCGAYCLWYVCLWRMQLLPDRISIESLTGTRELFRHQIRGWRILPSSPKCLVLQPSDKEIAKAKIALTFPIDDQLEQWFEPLPCLDIDEAAASEEEITGDRRLGEHPTDRAAALARAKRLASRMTVASMVICGWGWFYPRPYTLVILVLIALPWVGIEVLRRSNGLFRADQRRNDAHPTVAYVLIFPPLILMLRSVLDYNVFQSPTAFVLYALVGGIFVFLTAKFDPTLWANNSALAMFCLFGLAYGYGVVTQANALLDRSTGTTYSAIVQGKHVNNSKRTSYHLELSPWGPETKTNDLEISQVEYDPVQCGDTALLTLRRGALGLRWYYYLGARLRGGAPSPCK